MTVVVGTNIAALRALRQSTTVSGRLNGTFERLASGQRINRAGDDAAGLSIADALRLETRVGGQAVRNVNDAISYLSIAEGAVTALKDVLQRAQELAEQSANGVYSNTQRQPLDEELTALQREYNRIVDSTTFNGRNMLSNPQESVVIQAGFGANAQLAMNLGTVRTSDGTFDPFINQIAEPVGYVDTADVNNDGLADLITTAPDTGAISAYTANGDGSFSLLVSRIEGGATATKAADVNGDGLTDIVSAVVNAGVVAVLIQDPDGSFQPTAVYATATTLSDLMIGDVDGDGDEDVVAGSSSDAAFDVYLNNGDGTFAPRIVTGDSTVRRGELRDVDGDGNLDLLYSSATASLGVSLGNGDGTFGVSTVYSGGNTAGGIAIADVDGDGVDDVLVTDSFNDNVTFYRGIAGGTFQNGVGIGSFDGAQDVTAGDFNGDGVIDAAVTHSAGVSVMLGNGDGTFGSATFNATQGGAGSNHVITSADFNGDGWLDLVSNNRSGGGVSILLAHTFEQPVGVRRLSGLSVATQSEARLSLGRVRQSLDELNAISGSIGAWMSRFESVTASLSIGIENMKSAESGIRDADVATDSAVSVQSAILQQAAISVLAQASQQPALALELLR